MVAIYMPLLDEGVETWRPVDATPLSGDTYRVDSALPDDEEWAFPPGAIVRCEQRTFYDGELGLTAIETVS